MPPCKAKHACTQTHKHTTLGLDLCILLYFCCCFFVVVLYLLVRLSGVGGASVGQDQPDPAAHRTVVTHHGANATNLSTLDYPSRMKHHTYAIHLIVMTNAHNHRPRTDSHASLIAMHTHTHGPSRTAQELIWDAVQKRGRFILERVGWGQKRGGRNKKLNTNKCVDLIGPRFCRYFIGVFFCCDTCSFFLSPHEGSKGRRNVENTLLNIVFNIINCEHKHKRCFTVYCALAPRKSKSAQVRRLRTISSQNPRHRSVCSWETRGIFLVCTSSASIASIERYLFAFISRLKWHSFSTLSTGEFKFRLLSVARIERPFHPLDSWRDESCLIFFKWWFISFFFK